MASLDSSCQCSSMPLVMLGMARCNFLFVSTVILVPLGALAEIIIELSAVKAHLVQDCCILRGQHTLSVQAKTSCFWRPTSTSPALSTGS